MIGAVDAGDLDIVGRCTGDRWVPLGPLTGGGSGDLVYLVGRAGKRAVLKVKRGAWWAGQVVRAVDAVRRLRDAGYPTPPILHTGRLDQDRAFLLTPFLPGRSRARLEPRLLDEVLAAVQCQSVVHPPPVRDWSAMVTAFLDDGVAEVAFHPRLTPLADQAMALIRRPVPALPTGDFVHGDFTLRNMLVQRGRLSAVIDVEGFGRGTPVIDLVALLQTTAHPIHGDHDLARRLTDQAIAISGPDTFATCVIHRVLAVLAAVTDHPDQLHDAHRRARGLLALLP